MCRDNATRKSFPQHGYFYKDGLSVLGLGFLQGLGFRVPFLAPVTRIQFTKYLGVYQGGLHVCKPHVLMTRPFKSLCLYIGGVV